MKKNLVDNVCEEQIFSSVYRKYAQELYNYLYYRFGEDLGPGDKMQDAFVKLLAQCKEVSPDKAKGFLFSIAKNMMLNELKHQKVVLKYQKIVPRRETIESPEFLLEEKQFLERYQKALQNLTEDQRVSFLMNKAEGKKHAEIASILGVTQKAVENRIYTAHRKLKEELEGFYIK